MKWQCYWKVLHKNPRNSGGNHWIENGTGMEENGGRKKRKRKEKKKQIDRLSVYDRSLAPFGESELSPFFIAIIKVNPSFFGDLMDKIYILNFYHSHWNYKISILTIIFTIKKL